MRLPIITSMVILFAFAADGASAACPVTNNGQVKNSNGNTQGPNTLTGLLNGNTVCATRGSNRWQEQHRTNGELWDYKKGPTNKVDPTAKVGMWAVSGSAGNTAVTHTYTGGQSYVYKVQNNVAGSYTFCGTTNVDFTVKQGIGGC